MRGINVISFHCCLLSLNAWNAYIKERREYNAAGGPTIHLTTCALPPDGEGKVRHA
jgi:hypothetical protein